MTAPDLAEFVSDYVAMAPDASNKEIAEAYADYGGETTPEAVAYYTEKEDD